MKSFFLNVARSALAAWIGAATIFVITAVKEVTSPDLTSIDKSRLALLRFPTYYTCGFFLVPLALVAGLLAWNHAEFRGTRACWVLGLVSLALATMLADYFAVYQPLTAMLINGFEALPEKFQSLHQASKYINSVDVGLCMIAEVILLLTPSQRETT